MLDKLRQYLLKKEISKQTRISKFKSWNEIKNVLLLFESDIQEKNSGVKELINKLQDEEGKKVVACCFVNKKKAIAATLDSYIVLSREEINMWGRPKEEAINSMLDEEYDMVMDLSTEKIIPLEYILTLANTKFRCGKNLGNNELHDFVIEMPKIKTDEKTGIGPLESNEARELGEQIIKYLKQVKSI